jgi:D-amino-acid dehydrogenase
VTGELIVALSDDELGRLDQLARRAEELVAEHGPAGIGTPERLAGDDVRRRFPGVSTAVGGLWLPEVARIDGRVVRSRLAEMALKHGASFVDSTGELALSAGRVTGVRADGGLVECDHAVVATGAWTNDVLAAAGVELAIYPQRGQIVHLRLPGGSELPVLNTLRGHYLLSFPGDRVVIGATREDGSGFDAHPTAGGIDLVIRQGLSVVPGLADAEWIEVRVGLRPASRDGEPFLGQAPGVEGLWVATGFGPQGLTLGPYSGQVLAASILDTPTLDVPILDAPMKIPAEFFPER